MRSPSSQHLADLRADPLSSPAHGQDTGTRPCAIHRLNLTIPDGKTVVVPGPSGCGKTTLLKIIAGLIPPDSGEVRYNGVNMNDVPLGKRPWARSFRTMRSTPT